MKNRFWIPVVWGLAWLGLPAYLLVFFRMIISWDRLGVWWVIIGLMAVLALGIAALAYANRENEILVQITGYGSRCALVLAVIIALLAGFGRLGFIFHDVRLSLLWFFGFYLGLLAVGLSGAAVRLAFPKCTWISVAVLIYVVIALVLLFPAPPISLDTYNAVGLFFPFWVWGAPTAAAVKGLVQLGRASSSN